MKSSKGFTLGELLAVISILGVILVFVVPAMLDAMTNSKKILNEYTEDGILDAAKTYLTDYDQNVKKYVYQKDTPWTSSYSNKTYNKGDKLSSYDFKIYMNETDGFDVSIIELVQGGYYNQGCDYDTKPQDCSVKKECIVHVELETDTNKQGYLETKGYNAKIVSGCEKNN